MAFLVRLQWVYTCTIALFSVVSLGFAQQVPFLSRGLIEENPETLEVFVEPIDSAGEAIGLTSTRVQNRVAVRLRGVGITAVPASATSTGNGYLYINVNVMQRAAYVSLFYSRIVSYSLTAESGYRTFANTWNNGSLLSFAPQDRTAGSLVISELEELLDEFLIDYFNANPHFGTSAPPPSPY